MFFIRIFCVGSDTVSCGGLSKSAKLTWFITLFQHICDTLIAHTKLIECCVRNFFSIRRCVRARQVPLCSGILIFILIKWDRQWCPKKSHGCLACVCEWICNEIGQKFDTTIKPELIVCLSVASLQSQWHNITVLTKKAGIRMHNSVNEIGKETHVWLENNNWNGMEWNQ